MKYDHPRPCNNQASRIDILRLLAAMLSVPLFPRCSLAADHQRQQQVCVAQKKNQEQKRGSVQLRFLLGPQIRGLRGLCADCTERSHRVCTRRRVEDEMGKRDRGRSPASSSSSEERGRRKSSKSSKQKKQV